MTALLTRLDYPHITEFFPDTEIPLEVEIGCGKGKFLVERAETLPGVNFLGLDRVGKWMKRPEKRAERNRLGNVRFLKAEARAYLSRCLTPESVSVFHVYFPDPWPKRRQQKRRLVSEEFMRLVYSRLKPGGLLELVTDDARYAERMNSLVGAMEPRWQKVVTGLPRPSLGTELKTNYELKFAADGRPIYYLEARK